MRCIECDCFLFSLASRERGTCAECHDPEAAIPIDLEDQLENAMKNSS